MAYATLTIDEFRPFEGLEVLAHIRATVRYKDHYSDFFDYFPYSISVYGDDGYVAIDTKHPLWKPISDAIQSERYAGDVQEAIRKDKEWQRENYLAQEGKDRAHERMMEGL